MRTTADARCMWRLANRQPVTLSLSDQPEQPAAWIDCVVKEVRHPIALLAPRAPLSDRLCARLAQPELGYIAFEERGAPIALKGFAVVAPGETALDFLILDDERATTTPRPVGGEAILRLMYVSRAAPDLVEADYHEILTASNRLNAGDGVTGALCLHDGFFAQILEGDEPAVRETYARIVEDERHSEPVLLFEERAEHRLYAGWAMKGIAGEHALTAADELAARLRLAKRSDAASLTRRWLELLQAGSPGWRAEWLEGRRSVLMLRELVDVTARASAR